jgi:hypothetical protein
MYLPALTQYGFREIPLRTPGQFPRSEKTGRYYDKYTGGVAIMQAPFYLGATVFSVFHQRYAPDGYNPAYQMSVLLAALFYGILGLVFLYWILREDFPVIVSAAVVLFLFLGTNLFYYMKREPGMAHASSFFLWTVVLWLTRRIYRDGSWKHFIFLALAVSLLVFIRPSNAVAALVILFWDAGNLRERVQYLFRNIGKYAILIVPFIGLAIVQVLLWRHMAGETVFFLLQP